MKKKMYSVLLMTIIATMANVTTVFADASSVTGKWYYDTKNEETNWWFLANYGVCLKNNWYWIDGNCDGTEECYYFNENGWLITDGQTPDGKTVNADGALIVNNVVQTKQVDITNAANSSFTQNLLGWTWKDIAFDSTVTYTPNINWLITYSPSPVDAINKLINPGIILGTKDNFGQFTNSKQGLSERISVWSQSSEAGKGWKELFDYYGIPYNLNLNHEVTSFSVTSGSATIVDQQLIYLATMVMAWITSDEAYMSGVDILVNEPDTNGTFLVQVVLSE